MKAQVSAALSAALLLAGGVGLAAMTGRDEVLNRAIAYVNTFERTFSAVTWHEHYEQEDRELQRFNSSGSTASRLVGRRTLEAHFLLVWLQRDATWIAVRDVISVDGKPRDESERALSKLSSNGASISMAELMTLAAENGRFNIGRIVRTFNEPTLTLIFLDDHYRDRFSFDRRGEESIGGVRASLYRFVERERPTVIRNGNRSVPTSGTLWIDPDTGRILQTFMSLADGDDLHATMTVRYGPFAGFDVLVPLEMRETYRAKSGEQVTAIATYSDFRRFEASGRLIVPR